jgi:alkylation response protein AidB-like acyl-CoA dehydrogenase
MFMNNHPSSSMNDYLARAKALAPVIEGGAAAAEQTRQLAPEVVQALIDGGFYRMLQPKFLGGGELPPANFMAVIEEIAKADASAAWCVGQCGTCAMAAAYLDRDSAREIFGPADGIVAWGPPASSVARVVDGGYRVTGKWNFASGSHQATWIGAQSFVVNADGQPRRRNDGAPVIRTMLVPRKDVRLQDAWNVMGLKGTGSDSYALEDVFVPERFTMGRDEAEDRREDGLLYKFSMSNVYSLVFAALALGIARRMLDDARAVVIEKLPYGMKQPLRENNVIQAQIGRAEGGWRAARGYIYATAESLWQSMAKTPSLSLDQRIELRLSSVWTIHQAEDIARTVFRMVGSTAIFESAPFERRFRDIQTVTQQLQGRQSHFESVGQVLLGLEPDAALFTT